MNLRQAAQQALKEMDDHMYRADTHEFYEAKEALRAALADPEQEPVDSPEKAVAYMDARLWEFIDMAAAWPETRPDSRTWDHVMVYAPTPRKPLTEKEIDHLMPYCHNEFDLADYRNFARAIERAHGIGEQDE